MARSRTPPHQAVHAIQLQIRVYGPRGRALGPGRIELLEHIEETGSIREAARCMGMSYNRAWILVRSTNESFESPLVVATRGGDRRGGAQVTPEGRKVITQYRSLEEHARRAIEPTWKQLRRRLKGGR
jgi:molybdate transport system regulatory protein